MQTTNIKKYDKYKDSGIDWIGEIPVEWDIKRLKILANIQTGNTPPKEHSTNTYYSDDGMLWVKPDNLSEFNPITDTKEKLNNEGLKIAKIVPPYTPLICCIGTIGKFGLSAQTVAFNQQINAVIFNKRMLSRFGLYVISCQEEQHWFYANGNVVKILNTQNQGQIVFPCPQITEQQQIVDYLDNKCGKIDRVINTQKNIIEKLKEYKQAVITEAVTKGLDNSAKLKDSGIEWIGKIPEHWAVCKIKHCVIFNPCYSENLKKDTLVSFAPMDCLTNCNLNCKESTIEKISSGYTYFAEEDIIMAKVTPCFENGNIAIAKNLLNRIGFGTSELYVFRAKNINNKFLLYFLQNRIFKDMAISTMYGTGGLKRVSSNFVKNYKFGFPRKNEQQNIADYLDKKCSEIDIVISEKEQLIEKLTEYKKSIIYECVTGKRKVA